MKLTTSTARILLILALNSAAAACSPQKDGDGPQSQPQAQTQQAQQTQNPGQTANQEQPSDPAAGGMMHMHMHDPANPPVDCPLRRQGIDPTKMKPFEQVEAYINFLEQENRRVWQKPEEVVEAMGLQGNERVLDLGAGSGYFSFPIAQKLTASGRLFAADVEPEMVRHIHHRAMESGAQNVEALLVDAEKPKIPEKTDVVFICDVMHHVARPQEWLTGIVEQLPAGARMHIIEFKPGDIPGGPPAAVKIAPEKLQEIAVNSGLRLERRDDDLLPYQNYYIFRKPAVGE